MTTVQTEDQYSGDNLAQTVARYARTFAATRRHIIAPDCRDKTLCGGRVSLREQYLGSNGVYRTADPWMVYELPACARCEGSARKRGITADTRTRRIEAAHAEALAEHAERIDTRCEVCGAPDGYPFGTRRECVPCARMVTAGMRAGLSVAVARQETMRGRAAEARDEARARLREVKRVAEENEDVPRPRYPEGTPEHAAYAAALKAELARWTAGEVDPTPTPEFREWQRVTAHPGDAHFRAEPEEPTFAAYLRASGADTIAPRADCADPDGPGENRLLSAVNAFARYLRTSGATVETTGEALRAIVEPRADCADPDCAALATMEGAPLLPAYRVMLRRGLGTTHLSRDGWEALCGGRVEGSPGRPHLTEVDCLTCLDRYTEASRKASLTY